MAIWPTYDWAFSSNVCAAEWLSNNLATDHKMMKVALPMAVNDYLWSADETLRQLNPLIHPEKRFKKV
jgi:hypothetical protein